MAKPQFKVLAGANGGIVIVGNAALRRALVVILDSGGKEPWCKALYAAIKEPQHLDLEKLFADILSGKYKPEAEPEAPDAN